MNAKKCESDENEKGNGDSIGGFENSNGIQEKICSIRVDSRQILGLISVNLRRSAAKV